MKKIPGLLLLSCFTFLVAGCSDITSTTFDFPELSYDSTIMHASLDGFRIQMSPRMAKQIAEERGYKIDSFFSSVTFEDIIEAGFEEGGLQEPICLERYDEDKDCSYRIMLNFRYGKTEIVQLDHEFKFQQKRAEEMLDFYLKRFPQLRMEKKEGNFQVYHYEPNKRANIILTATLGEGISNVSISVSDINYTMSQIYQEAYKYRY